MKLRYRIRNFFRELSWPKKCPMCQSWSITVKRRYNGCRYQEDHCNYNSVCLECMKEIWEQVQDMWDSYWSSIL